MTPHPASQRAHGTAFPGLKSDSRQLPRADVVIVGIDLAWGLRQCDAVASIGVRSKTCILTLCDEVHGDEALLASIEQHTGTANRAILAIDAPIICRNATGARPVDTATHRIFHRQHAACHPANSRLCARPAALGPKLERAGFALDWDLTHQRIAFEVYPHPATIRFFGLERIIKYKRGPVANRRDAFRKFQALVLRLVQTFQLIPDVNVIAVLEADWKKSVEDRVDAILCAMIGWNHWLHRGEKSEILGDRETGFLVIPTGPPQIRTTRQ